MKTYKFEEMWAEMTPEQQKAALIENGGTLNPAFEIIGHDRRVYPTRQEYYDAQMCKNSTALQKDWKEKKKAIIANARKAFSKHGKLIESFKNSLQQGRYWDVVERRDAGGIKTDLGVVQSNVVISTLPKLFAGLLANEGTFSGGILYHAIGEGLQAWDVTLDPPTFDLEGLENEFFRKPPESILYIDENGNPTAQITDVIRVKTVFDFNEANGAFIREQGVVGGNATAIIGSGLYVNAIRHKGIFKDDATRLTRFIEFLL